MTAAQQTLPGWLEQAWLDRYLDRGLTQEELEWFEVYVLDKAHLLQCIEADSDLRDGLAAVEAERVASLDRGGAARSSSITRRKAPSRGSIWLARAAAVLLSVMGGWWGASMLGVSSGPGATEVVTDPMRIVFDTQRGVADEPLVFNAGSGSAWVVVEVSVPFDASDVQLIVDGEPPRKLTVTSEGFASFLWPRVRQEASLQVNYRLGSQRAARMIEVPATTSPR
jgi:hypothetical protein